jgi:succinoglycan biosynthesis protein ExoA
VNEEHPSVSVIIPARDAAASLPRTLASISAQTYPNIKEVIVASADDETSAAARSVTIVRNPEGSTPLGLNAALAASSGEVIVRCDAHSVLPPEYIEHAVATLLRTGADNVGGMQVPIGRTDWEKAIATAMSSPFGAGNARYRIGGDEGPVETVYLGVFRRNVLERVGGFDENFTRTQDYELNHRIISSGGTVWFDPLLRVEYRPRGSLRALARQYYDYGRAKRSFNRKHPGSLRWRQLAAPILTVTVAAGLIGAIWWRALLVIPATYLIGLLVAGIASGRPSMRVSLALATMHLSWGIGFLLDRKDDSTWSPGRAV